MIKAKKIPKPSTPDDDFFGRLWDESWIYIKTIVDVVHEPVLILNDKLCVMAANDPFYRMFQVDSKNTEDKLVYKLGNGQWNIPALRELLEEILPNNTFFNGFQVTHAFPIIGNKVMMLNAREIHFQNNKKTNHIPRISLLAIEDVTDMMAVADSLANHVREFEAIYSARTEELEKKVALLLEERIRLKK